MDAEEGDEEDGEHEGMDLSEQQVTVGENYVEITTGAAHRANNGPREGPQASGSRLS
jgi:hypothetical protein